MLNTSFFMIFCNNESYLKDALFLSRYSASSHTKIMRTKPLAGSSIIYISQRNNCQLYDRCNFHDIHVDDQAPHVDPRPFPITRLKQCDPTVTMADHYNNYTLFNNS